MLTLNIGYRKLIEHLGAVVTMMQLSTTYAEFKVKLDRLRPIFCFAIAPRASIESSDARSRRVRPGASSRRHKLRRAADSHRGLSRALRLSVAPRNSRVRSFRRARAELSPKARSPDFRGAGFFLVILPRNRLIVILS
jgi:hypothetical protein